MLLASGEANEADRLRWQAWRAADPLHEVAWQRAEAVTARFAGISPDQATVTRAALQAAPNRRAARRRALGGLAGLGLVGWFGWQGWLRTDLSADAVTAVGEQRDLELPDGTRLRLDTDTVIDVALSATGRMVHLRRGRLLVTTGHAAGMRAAPFWVATAQGHVQALGTRFSVRQDEGVTLVVVIEARVALHVADAGRPRAAGAEMQLGAGRVPIVPAGQAVRFNRQGLLDQQAARSSDAAWARGMLIADDMVLADFVAELARYRATPLVCDPALRDLRISGTYPLTDSDGALRALTRALPVRLLPRRPGDPSAGWWVTGLR